MIQDKKHLIRFLTIIAWAFWYVLPFLINEKIQPNYNFTYFACNTFLFGLSVGYYYLNYGLLLTKYLAKQRFILFGIFFLLGLLSYSTVYVLSNNFFKSYLDYQNVPYSISEKLPFQTKILLQTIPGTFYALLAAAIRITGEWINNHQLKTELENKTLSIELSSLRAQINPHFLFNTLNNIYTLVYKKSDLAPEAVLKLSSVMRYMLYETDTSYVSLKNEIQYINDFIELQQLRQPKDKFVSFAVNGNPEKRLIAPLILIPFIENAFKHGDMNATSPGIKITLDLEKDICLQVENYINPHPKKQAGGLGLENVRRRLELIYPKKHELNIEVNDKKHFVHLTIVDYKTQ